jgi:hypothetical protein
LIFSRAQMSLPLSAVLVNSGGGIALLAAGKGVGLSVEGTI